MRSRRITAPALVLLVSFAVAGCGSSATKMLHTANIARAIERSIAVHQGISVVVRCPAVVTDRPGDRFACTASLAVGSYPVFVVDKNANGAVSFSNSTPLRVLDIQVVERTIESALKQRKHQRSAAHCPSPVLQKAGLAFTCTATMKHAAVSFSVTEIDGSGHISLVER